MKKLALALIAGLLIFSGCTGKKPPASGPTVTSTAAPRKTALPTDNTPATVPSQEMSPEKIYREGSRLARMRKYPQALVLLDQVLKAQPEHFKALFDRGVVLHRTGKLKEALADLNHVARIRPDYYVLYTRALILRDLNKPDKAIADLDAAIEKFKNFIDGYTLRGEIYSTLGRRKEALADFTRAIAMEKDRRHYNRRGVEYAVDGQYKKAGADLQRAIEMAPAHPSATDTMGYLYLLEGHPRKAEKCFQKAISLDPDQPYSYGSLAYVMNLDGNRAEAVKLYKQAAERNRGRQFQKNLERLAAIDPKGRLGRMAKDQLSQFKKAALPKESFKKTNTMKE